jgi:hypothetical protein
MVTFNPTPETVTVAAIAGALIFIPAIVIAILAIRKNAINQGKAFLGRLYRLEDHRPEAKFYPCETCAYKKECWPLEIPFCSNEYKIGGTDD